MTKSNGLPCATLAKVGSVSRRAWLQRWNVSAVVSSALLGALPEQGRTAATTATQFSVTEGGSASVSIPIQVPRGIGGMEPQLTLSYSSGSGNGLLGLGWTLLGPSSVARCPKVKAIPADGERGVVTFGAGDRFCLDGQRLLLVDPNDDNAATAPNQANYGAAGSEYRTERDSFSRVRAVGNFVGGHTPLGFTVETKSGLILEFGNTRSADGTVNSLVMTNPRPPLPGQVGPSPAINTINRWMLRRISDRVGNHVDFEYCKGEVLPNGPAPFAASSSSSCVASGAWSGSSPLHYIRYTSRGTTSNGSFAVVFRYDVRPDRVRTFYRGSATEQTQRLTAIQTYRNFVGPGSGQLGQLVRSYDVFYDPLENAAGQSVRASNVSRISAIQERGSDGALPPLPQVRFTMASDAVFGKFTSHQAGPPPAEPPPGQGCTTGTNPGNPALACP